MISKRTWSITLLSLLLAAASCGAAAMFLGHGPIVGQAVGTVIAACVFVAILMAICHRLNWTTDAFTIVGSAAVLIGEFCCLLLGLWTSPTFKEADLIAMFAAIIAGAGIPSCFYLYLRPRPFGRWAGYAGLVTCAVGALLWTIAAIETYLRRGNQEATGLLAGAIVGFGVPMAVSLIGAGTDRRWWRWAGVIAAGGAMIVVFRQLHDPEIFLFPLGSLAVVIAAANALAIVPLPPAQRWLAQLTTAFIASTAVIYNVGLSCASRPWDPDSLDELYSRITGAGVFLCSGGLLAIAVVVRINRGSRKPQELPTTLALGDVQVTCPMCQTSLTTQNGIATCGQCGIRLHVKIEEPRCLACGYSLLMNHSDRCPECGAAA